MAFCIGRKCRNINACQNRCRGWFASQPDLERGCRKACKTDYDLTKGDFLCSGKWLDQAAVMGAYGYDPCPGLGIELQDYLDPTGQRQAEAEQAKNVEPWLLIGAALIVVGLMVIVVLRRK